MKEKEKITFSHSTFKTMIEKERERNLERLGPVI